MGFERATPEVVQSVERADGRLDVEEAESEASEAVIPLPKITRAAPLDHRYRQEKEHADTPTRSAD